MTPYGALKSGELAVMNRNELRIKLCISDFVPNFCKQKCPWFKGDIIMTNRYLPNNSINTRFLLL